MLAPRRPRSRRRRKIRCAGFRARGARPTTADGRSARSRRRPRPTVASARTRPARRRREFDRARLQRNAEQRAPDGLDAEPKQREPKGHLGDYSCAQAYRYSAAVSTSKASSGAQRCARLAGTWRSVQRERLQSRATLIAPEKNRSSTADRRGLPYATGACAPRRTASRPRRAPSRPAGRRRRRR